MFKVGLNNGIILSAVQILLLMVVHFAGKNPLVSKPTDPVTGITYVLSLLALVFFIRRAILQFRDQVNHGSISLGKAIGVGLITCLISILIGGVFFFLYYYVIDPDTANQLQALNQKELDKTGLKGEKLAQAKSISEVFLNPILLFAIQALMNIFLGLLISLIIGAIIRKD